MTVKPQRKDSVDENPLCSPYRNKDFQEVTLEKNGEVLLRFAAAYGFRNIQNVVLKLKKGKFPYHFVEVLACAGGKARGLRPQPQRRQARAGCPRPRGVWTLPCLLTPWSLSFPHHRAEKPGVPLEKPWDTVPEKSSTRGELALSPGGPTCGRVLSPRDRGTHVRDRGQQEGPGQESHIRGHGLAGAPGVGVGGEDPVASAWRWDHLCSEWGRPTRFEPACRDEPWLRCW